MGSKYYGFHWTNSRLTVKVHCSRLDVISARPQAKFRRRHENDCISRLRTSPTSQDRSFVSFTQPSSTRTASMHNRGHTFTGGFILQAQQGSFRKSAGGSADISPALRERKSLTRKLEPLIRSNVMKGDSVIRVAALARVDKSARLFGCRSQSTNTTVQ